MSTSPNQQLIQAAQRGDALFFDNWERNPGVIEMRKILRETQPNTGGRMARAQRAFVPIKALWEQMDKGMNNPFLRPFIPKNSKLTIETISNRMNTMFQRMRTDKEYAALAYNTFPVLADRYGAGMQSNGKPRLSFIRMIDDPLAKRLI
ncbi:hypothetical protein CBW53_02865 [Yersinia frederiksenii]|nr:hypothetical protein CBW53_02865 [Yersinia frederiksenii]